MLTTISTVAVADALSVTVQRKVVILDSSGIMLVAVNVVVAALGELQLMESPETFVHA